MRMMKNNRNETVMVIGIDHGYGNMKTAMRKRNHTVTIRMNKEEYDFFQSKVKESGRTQQEVVIKAIADLKIASAEEIEELKRLNQMFADTVKI